MAHRTKPHAILVTSKPTPDRNPLKIKAITEGKLSETEKEQYETIEGTYCEFRTIKKKEPEKCIVITGKRQESEMRRKIAGVLEKIFPKKTRIFYKKGMISFGTWGTIEQLTMPLKTQTIKK